ncbi:cytidylate kinase [Xylanibacillus composti]|uniref:Cytidylate kinase n=1 Tax=Xylanibacillus composti TaxID=1572762 RepID=A0A8J4M4S7_9BACL|nr:cytidylate kinase [Xylanibacillus composti]
MKQTDDRINVAIDGPAGAGKSTVAKLVAERLGYIYIDTGAMYRVVAYKALEDGVGPDHAAEAVRTAERLSIELRPGQQRQQVLADGEDVTDAIRSASVTSKVSAYASNPGIRDILVRKQQEMARKKGVVMDGRDIGTKVLPDAEVKIYLTASVEKRAQRRFEELPEGSTTMEELREDIARRDEMDRNREHSPLVQAEDAIRIDSTDMSIEEVTEKILAICSEAIARGVEQDE